MFVSLLHNCRISCVTHCRSCPFCCNSCRTSCNICCFPCCCCHNAHSCSCWTGSGWPCRCWSKPLHSAANSVRTVTVEWPTVAQRNMTGCLHISNIDGHSWFHLAVQIYKYYISECLLVALGTQHALLMRHIANCCLPGCTLFFHSVSNGRIFGKSVHMNIVFRCFCTTVPWSISNYNKNLASIATARLSACAVALLLSRFGETGSL